MQADDRKLVIDFNNQTRLELTFPKQAKASPGAVLETIKKALELDKLVIEADGKLLMIPWTSIKSIELTPAPPAEAMPFGAIRGAHVVAPG